MKKKCEHCRRPIVTKTSLVSFDTCEHVYHLLCGPKTQPRECPACKPGPTMTSRKRTGDPVESRRRERPISADASTGPEEEAETPIDAYSEPTEEVFVKPVPRWQSISDPSTVVEPVQDPPPGRELFGWLARTIAPFVATHKDPSPDEDIYTCLFRRQSVPGASAGSGILGENVLRWKTLEAVCLAGADVADFLENGYTLDDLLCFPDCCLGRLLEMGLTMKLLLEYRAAFPLVRAIETFCLSPDIVIHDLGMRVSMCRDDGLSLEVLHMMGMRAPNLCQAGLWESIRVWDSLQDTGGFREKMGFDGLHNLAIKCWRNFITHKPLQRSDALAIDKYPRPRVEALFLPPSLVTPLQDLLPTIGQLG